MDDILKGNYGIPGIKDIKTEQKPTASLQEKFEAAAMEELGGSITFVKKSGQKPGTKADSFIWRGDNE